MGDWGRQRIAVSPAGNLLRAWFLAPPRKMGGASRRRPFPFASRRSASARPEASCRAEIFHHSDPPTHPDLIVLQSKPERQKEPYRARRRELQRGEGCVGCPRHRHQAVEPARKEQDAQAEKYPGVARRRPLPGSEPILKFAALPMKERHRIHIESARLIEPHTRGGRIPIARSQCSEILSKRADSLPDPKRSERRTSGAAHATTEAEATGIAGSILTLRRHCAPPRPLRSEPPSSSGCRRFRRPSRPPCARQASASP